MNYIAVVLSLLVGGSSLAFAQSTGGSTGGGSAASGTAAPESPGYVGGTLSTGHAISGTGAPSGPTTGNVISHSATDDPGASSVAQPPPPHDNAVDTPTAKSATQNLGNTDTGILKK